MLNTINIPFLDVEYVSLPFTENFENGMPCNWENSYSSETILNLSPQLKSKLLTIAPTLQPKAVAASCAVFAVCSKQTIERLLSKSLIDFSALLTGSLLSILFTVF